ncbi:MAG: phosphotransferase [Cellvibrionales bacterium]|nr:phosphotransferase [Cellvibrionales bacterium]
MKVDTNLFESLSRWIKRLDLGELKAIEKLVGDASTRQYFRVQLSDNSYVAVIAPKESLMNTAFVQIQKLFLNMHVPVPEIISEDKTQGFMLQEDLGDTMMLNRLTSKNVDAIYPEVFDYLLTFLQLAPSTIADLPLYDEAFFRREMDQFDKHFLSGWLGLELNANELIIVEKAKTFLIEKALEQPYGFVHRDFHSRNMMFNDNRWVVIDFQDAVQGPLTYDLVSLLKDCYIDWPDEQVEQWVKTYYDRLVQNPKAPFANWPYREFLTQFHLMGLQRHLKVLGIFTRLAMQDQKTNYLQYLPRVFQYILSVTGRYEAMADFNAFLLTKVAALVEQKLASHSLPSDDSGVHS